METNWITCPNCTEIEGSIVKCSEHTISQKENNMTIPTNNADHAYDEADTPIIREAIVNPHSKLSFTEADELLNRVQAYLPSGYTATLVTANNLSFRVKISGTDDHGWTLDDYVIPRLASGNMFAEETDSSKLGVV